MFLVIGACVFLSGMVVVTYQFSPSTFAGSPFRNGSYNVVMGLMLVSLGGMGLVPEGRRRTVVGFQVVCTASMAVMLALLIGWLALPLGG